MSLRRGSPNLPDHPKELPTHMEVYRPSRGEVDPYPESPRGGWRCGLSTTQHWLTRPSHATMFFHGSKTKTSTHPFPTVLRQRTWTLTGPRSLFWARYRGPHPPTHPMGKKSRFRGSVSSFSVRLEFACGHQTTPLNM